MMRPLTGLSIVLLWPAIVCSLTVTAPQELVVDGADYYLPIRVSGGELFKGAIVNVAIPSPFDVTIIGIERKAGTVMQASSNTPEPPIIYDYFGPDGVGESAAIYSEFWMGPMDPAARANGTLAFIHVYDPGFHSAILPVVLSDLWRGLSTQLYDADGVAIPTELVNGSFIPNPPEPVSLALAGLGWALAMGSRGFRNQPRHVRRPERHD